MALPLVERKRRLKALLGCQDEGLQFVEHLEGDGAKIFKAACRLGLEGIVSKRADSTYRAGRSTMWLKIKNRNHPALIRVAESFERYGQRSS
jgi:bifunctional non-homologous end joining protein LigD